MRGVTNRLSQTERGVMWKEVFRECEDCDGE